MHHKAIPGPRGLPLLGVINARDDTLGFYRDCHARYGELTRYQALKKFEWYFVAHPEDIQQVLLGSHETYYKGVAWERLRMLLGNGLLASNGDHWKRQRRLLLPAFARGHHARYGEQMGHVTQEILGEWRVAAREGRTLELTSEMMRLALLNAGGSLLGTDMRPVADEVGQHLSLMIEYLQLRGFSWEAWRGRKGFDRALHALHAIVDGVIARRRAAPRPGDEPRDVLDILLEARDEETGEPLSERDLRDEVITVLVAGHETVAVALTWTSHLLSQHPLVAERMRAEVDQVVGSRAPQVGDLPRLPFVKAVVQESMRLYPPVWALSRQTEGEVPMRGYTLPHNALMLIMPYVTHRHPDFWDDPETFDPDRWSEERSRGRHKFAYFPFGGGPHLCIGAGFAMMEAQLAIAAIAQRFDVDVVPGQTIEPTVWMTLRPRHGLHVTLRERSA